MSFPFKKRNFSSLDSSEGFPINDGIHGPTPVPISKIIAIVIAVLFLAFLASISIWIIHRRSRNRSRIISHPMSSVHQNRPLDWIKYKIRSFSTSRSNLHSPPSKLSFPSPSKIPQSSSSYNHDDSSAWDPHFSHNSNPFEDPEAQDISYKPSRTAGYEIVSPDLDHPLPQSALRGNYS